MGDSGGLREDSGVASGAREGIVDVTGLRIEGRTALFRHGGLLLQGVRGVTQPGVNGVTPLDVDGVNSVVIVDVGPNVTRSKRFAGVAWRRRRQGGGLASSSEEDESEDVDEEVDE